MQKKEASSLLKPIGKIFKKFHLLIFFVFIIACLSIAVITTNAIVTGEDTASKSILGPNSGTATPGTGTSSTSIDSATLQRIQSLKPSTEPSTYTPPQDIRNNPFAE